MKVMKFEGRCIFNDNDTFMFDTFNITERGDILVEISGDSEFGLYTMNFRLVKENGRYRGHGTIKYTEKNRQTDTVDMTIKESAISFRKDICKIERGFWELKTPEWNKNYYFSGELEQIPDK